MGSLDDPQSALGDHLQNHVPAMLAAEPATVVGALRPVGTGDVALVGFCLLCIVCDVLRCSKQHSIERCSKQVDQGKSAEQADASEVQHEGKAMLAFLGCPCQLCRITELFAMQQDLLVRTDKCRQRNKNGKVSIRRCNQLPIRKVSSHMCSQQ